mmetsp:Transcript_7034/g.8060  ORF Transcript_7034/g.8060 Transcript_7034/m.8060 type:complete len:327 (-) Transcript_7034:1754-2734(-)
MDRRDGCIVYAMLGHVHAVTVHLVQEQWCHDQSDGCQHLDKDVEGGASGIFERIPDSVSGDGSLVRLAILAPESASLHILLGVIPGATRIVQEESHQNTGDCSEHQHSRHNLGSQEGLPSVQPNVLEERPHHNGSKHCKHSGFHHFLEGGCSHDGDTSAVVWLLVVGHDARSLQELEADLTHHGLRRAAHCGACKGTEEEHKHGANKSSNPDLWDGDVNFLEWDSSEGGNFVHVGTEQQERCQGCRTNGISLGGGLCGVAHSVQQVGDLTNILRLRAHLDNSSGVVCNWAKDVHGEHIRRSAQHSHGGNCCSKETTNGDTVCILNT